MRKFCLSIAICLGHCLLHAQTNLMNGFLHDSITHFAIKGARISNTANGKNSYSNQKGFFSIAALSGDVIVISIDGYNQRIISYSPLSDTITIYLSTLATTLPTVSVSSRYNQYQLDSINRKRDFLQMRGGRLSNFSRAEGFGIAFNLDRILKRKYKNQRKNEKYFREREKTAYITFRYSPQLVAYYTGLKDEELQKFMASHTPTYTWLRKHTTDEQVFDYINDQLKLFKANTK